jgi:hypothetical protein
MVAFTVTEVAFNMRHDTTMCVSCYEDAVDSGARATPLAAAAAEEVSRLLDRPPFMITVEMVEEVDGDVLVALDGAAATFRIQPGK